MEYVENLGKYDRIDKVTLVDPYDESIKYYNCYLLTGKDVPAEFEVDTTSDMFFNTEYRVEDRETVAVVNNIDEIIDFLNHNQFATDVEEFVKTSHGEPVMMTVGGEKNMLIFSNLEFDWFANVLNCDADYILLKNKDGVCLEEIDILDFYDWVKKEPPLYNEDVDYEE